MLSDRISQSLQLPYAKISDVPEVKNIRVFTEAALRYAILELAKSSPFKDLADLSIVKVALDDPNHVWEL